MVRQTTNQQVHLFVVTSRPATFKVALYQHQAELKLTSVEPRPVQLGTSCYAYLLAVQASQEFKSTAAVEYQLWLDDGQQQSVTELQPELLYPGATRLSFMPPQQAQRILHGSCRKPHFNAKDGLAVADERIAKTVHDHETRPQVLLLTGDQVYIDDVAGPMLKAIEQVVDLLGLYNESFEAAPFSDAEGSSQLAERYYRRETWLPYTKNTGWFAEREVAIFSSVYCHNHLIALREMVALYLLNWSSSLWQLVEVDDTEIPVEFRDKFAQEQRNIDGFIETLPQVQRLLANITSYMIFDDHDITDDWNLTAAWEQEAYGHPFAKRIIGNAVWAYWLFQGWGNAPDKFEHWLADFQHYGEAPSSQQHSQLVDKLLEFEDWDYVVQSTPKIVVLDTRTRRWWSEKSPYKPSGLLDWEGLSDLQQQLKGEDQVVLASPAPIFGVKFIEAIQRVFTLFGNPLMVDAENWMAHPGSAHSILNIFKSRKTPKHFIILSGDVHYSFAYDVELRFRNNSPHIWQITSSGIKNTFPPTLIKWLDRFNRWLYSRHSPLNWFTKRRRMRVSQRKNSSKGPGKLLNASGIGYVEIGDDGAAEHISVLTSDGREVVFGASRD